MTGRKLGGGRILGTGKSLAPPSPPAHPKTGDLISPAVSTVSSRESSLSTFTKLPLPDVDQDLSSVVSLQNGESAVARAVGTQLYCPICNEEMMTLLQLNRHLDDNHQELPEVEQDEVKTWFDKQVVKAKNFQPLAVINQKLKGLDVFESNNAPACGSSTPSILSGNRTTTPEQARPDPDEVVTKAHWQKAGYNDQCTELACEKRLGPVNRSINCRKCGRLFCENHTMYQMKLSRSALHEPVRGLWCRVCETCFKSRDGYNDHHGIVRDLTSDFMSSRRKNVDKAYLEISRLEKRLTKLTQLLASPPDIISGNKGIMSLAGQKNQRKLLEQSIVTWEEDANVLKCPLCHQEFGSWSFRRHHCRLCGKIVCADLRTGCSSEIGLNVTAKTHILSEKCTGGLSVDIRICRNCKTTVFSKRDFEAEVQHKPPDQRAYENLVQFEKGIRLLLPNFQRLLVSLQDPYKPPTPAQLSEASKVRKRLIDSFGKYDIAAKRIRDIPSKGPIQLKLQRAIYQQSANFLNIHMLPLKSLPKILKHASPHGSTLPQGTSAIAAIKINDMETSSQVSSCSAVSVMEAEEKELRERLIIIEEQRYMLGEMITVARKARKFDEVTALGESITDLEREIDSLQGILGQLDFAGLYVGSGNVNATMLGLALRPGRSKSEERLR